MGKDQLVTDLTDCDTRNAVVTFTEQVCHLNVSPMCWRSPRQQSLEADVSCFCGHSPGLGVAQSLDGVQTQYPSAGKCKAQACHAWSPTKIAKSSPSCSSFGSASRRKASVARDSVLPEVCTPMPDAERGFLY